MLNCFASGWVKCLSSDNLQECLRPLQECISMWSLGYDWHSEDEQNPIWDLKNRPLMGQQVMDSVVSYLVYHVIHTEPPHRRTCLIPPSLFGNLKQLGGTSILDGVDAWLKQAGPEGQQQLIHQRAMVWTRLQAPTRVLIPIIDHAQAHCYLWYGDIGQKPGRTLNHCNLGYLDSLSRPSARVFNERLSEAKQFLKFLLPQVDGEITGSYEAIDGYRQAVGSTDCGLFVCQAVSALAWHHDRALQALLPVDQVRCNIIRILEECSDGALVKLTGGLVSKEPIILHRSPGIEPPPWLSHSPTQSPTNPPVKAKRPTWTPPKYERSLSEPTGELMLQTSRGGWEDIYGSSTGDTFASFSSGAFKGYLERIQQGQFGAPPGLLANAGAQLPEELLPSLFLGEHRDNQGAQSLPGIYIVEGNGESGLLFPEDGLSIGRLNTALAYLREGRERSLAVLTGTYQGKPLHVNWEKDTIDLEEEWLSVTLDVDSLSLTAMDPLFTITLVFHAYPPRASTFTTDNGLRVTVNGEIRPLSHCK